MKRGRKLLGLRPLTPEECRARYRAKQIAAGKCRCCLAREPEEGLKRCSTCLENQRRYASERQQRAKYDKRSAAGRLAAAMED